MQFTRPKTERLSMSQRASNTVNPDALASITNTMAQMQIETKNNFHKRTYHTHVSLKRVSDLADNPQSEEIIFQLFNPHFGLDKYLNADSMSDQLAQKFLQVLNRAYECKSMNGKLFILSDEVSKSRFLLKIIYDLLQKKSPDYNIDLIRSTMNLYTQMIKMNPKTIYNLESIKDRFEILVCNRIKNIDLCSKYEDEVENVSEQIKKRLETQKSKTFRTVLDDDPSIEPPDDFTQMNILPKLEDILQDQLPFLRKNITNGAYRNVRHYLDVQFRLLREDYLSPLREAVSKIRQITAYEKSWDALKRKISAIDSVNVYFDIAIQGSVLTDHGIVSSIRFLDMNRTRSINWESAKKLMFGSLVCFSSDFFTNECLIGVVCERDTKKLISDGVLNVKFSNDPNGMDEFDCAPVQYGSDRVYMMLETSAFFEAYKHVLEALILFSRLDESEFPFRENLIECKNTTMPMPKYLKNACIDFRPLVDDSKFFSMNWETQTHEFKFSEKSAYAEKCFLSNKAAWPTAVQMGLDNSQYDAVKLALESKLALIQGPPGTGKTYIGVKIVQLLLHNKHSWWNKSGERNKPILMVCYTNHALDQFLEYCINECNLSSGVVRVGGRCTSSRLNPFLLSTIKHSNRIDQKVYINIKIEKDNLRNLRMQIENLKDLINLSFNGFGVLNYETLKNYMGEKHAEQFKNHHAVFEGLTDRSSCDYALLDWFGLLSMTYNGYVYELYDPSAEPDNLKTQEVKINTDVKEEIVLEEQEDGQEGEEEVKQEEPETDFGFAENNERMLEDDHEFYEELEQNKEHVLNSMKQADRFNKSKFKYKHHIEDFIDLEEINYMYANFNAYYNGIDNSWTKTSHKRKKNDWINRGAGAYPVIDDNMNYLCEQNDEPGDLVDCEDIWKLDYRQRSLLYLHWLRKFEKEKMEKIEQLEEAFNLSAKTLQELRMQGDRSIMEKSLIIAMTTTGSSRYHKILQDIGPRIVIVEEAAEVFEAHVVSSLSKHCEHLILIGDHVQLRPNPTVYTLATQFKLDVSLFERLVNNDTKKVMLSCQHRMNPEISVLMKHFYPNEIQDHSSVLFYPSVTGLEKNIFFLNHPHLEREQRDSTSKINTFEAEFCVKLCEYILKQQHYCAQDITILSMYLGQMQEIRKYLRQNDIRQVKCSTVDNYQGEENKIIILSLVRSNKEDKIGFLSINNRVCVALSRAKHAFYCVGNFDFITRNNEKWNNIVKSLQATENYGNYLRLTCKAHPKEDIYCSKPQDFDLRIDGGCRLKCNYRLKCGHNCALHCHTYDLEHTVYKCRKACDKPMKCGHECQQTCSHTSNCNKCSVFVEKKVPDCGHAIKIQCDKAPERNMCSVKCNKPLKCGHNCIRPCSETNCSILPCKVELKVKSPCHHGDTIKVLCGDPKWTYREKCEKICNQTLECGHKCQNKCNECSGGLMHAKCKEKCDRTLYCGHKSQAQCAFKYLPCQLKCENRCFHSKCNLKCAAKCVPCIEKCAWQCKHKKCTKLCNEICNREPCNEPCLKKLKCGHQCIGLCGELCPKLCRICNKNIVHEKFFGNESKPNSRFVALKDCGHIFEYTGLDKWLQNNSKFNNKVQLPECPKCHTPIRLNFRYANLIKAQLDAINNIKIKQHGNIEQIKNSKEILMSQISLIELNDLGFMSAIRNELCRGFPSYNQLISYENTWNAFVKVDGLLEKVETYIDDPLYLAHLLYEVDKLKSYMFNKTAKFIYLNDATIIENVFREIERVRCLFKYYMYQEHFEMNENSLKKSDKKQINSVFEVLSKCLIESIKRFDDDLIENSKNLCEILGALLEYDIEMELDLDMDDYENDDEDHGINKEIPLDNWYRCAEGHIYCNDSYKSSKNCVECLIKNGGERSKNLNINLESDSVPNCAVN